LKPRGRFYSLWHLDKIRAAWPVAPKGPAPFCNRLCCPYYRADQPQRYLFFVMYGVELAAAGV